MNDKNPFFLQATTVAVCLILLTGAKLFSADGDCRLNDDGTILERYLGSGETLVVPEGVREINPDAFGFNSPLKTVVLPKSFEVAEGLLFKNCNVIESVDVAGDNPRYRSIDGVLFSKDAKTLLFVPPQISVDSYVVPEGAVSVGEGAFQGCSSLSSVTISKTVQSIGKNAFCGCSSLTSVDIPESVEKIGHGAFSGCRSLKAINVAEKNSQYSSIDGVLFTKDAKTLVDMPDGTETDAYVVPEGVEEIAQRAFASSPNLKSIVLSETVEIIGAMAFYSCSSLESVVVPKNVGKIGIGAFDNCGSLTSIDVAEDNSQFQTIDGVLFSQNGKTLVFATKSMKNERYVVPKTTETIISGEAFNLCPSLKEIVLSESVGEVGRGAFSDCSSLTSIDVEESNREFRSIDGVLFTKDGKTLIRYPAGRKDRAYAVPEGVEKIESGAFKNCSQLTSIVLPESVESIGDFAFFSCSSLAAIVLPKNVQEIGDASFCYCFSLRFFKIPENVKSIGNSAFEGCASFTKITVPESVVSIDQFAFVGCSKLTSIVIPTSVENIGILAFWGCEKLTVRAPKGSYAEQFALNNNIKFEPIE